MRHPFIATAIACASSVTAIFGARADEPAAPTERTVFYGYQNIAVSYTGLACFAAGGPSFSAGTALGGLIFLAGSPIVHGMHGDDGPRIAGSVVLNLAFPFFGGLIGSGSGGDKPGCANVNGGCLYDAVERTSRGVMIGMAIGPLLDGFILGWKTERVPAGITPTVSIARKEDPRSANTIGIRGVF